MSHAVQGLPRQMGHRRELWQYVIHWRREWQTTPVKSKDITLLTKVCIVKTVVFPGVTYGCENFTIKKGECQRIDDFKLWSSWTSLGLQDQNSQFWRKSSLSTHWKDWCWCWSFNILVIWCIEPTHWKRPCKIVGKD